ncbi:MAG: hypothetical protein KDC82_05860, partial [Bacteroidetes bacterium]|nr:hypothetical protein [Bacteroidota bacterium]
MQKLKYSLILLLALLGLKSLMAQYPNRILYDIESGLPSNEVYSMEQDANGFLWIGCDAGLFKFDGLRYTSFKSKAQNSNAISGLSFSKSGNLYCYNFQAQLFCLDQDSLKEIKHDFKKILSIEADNSGKIYVNHSMGISYWDENAQEFVHL